jgi:hypothetical protein
VLAKFRLLDQMREAVFLAMASATVMLGFVGWLFARFDDLPFQMPRRLWPSGERRHTGPVALRTAVIDDLAATASSAAVAIALLLALLWARATIRPVPLPGEPRFDNHGSPATVSSPNSPRRPGLVVRTRSSCAVLALARCALIGVAAMTTFGVAVLLWGPGRESNFGLVNLMSVALSIALGVAVVAYVGLVAVEIDVALEVDVVAGRPYTRPLPWFGKVFKLLGVLYCCSFALGACGLLVLGEDGIEDWTSPEPTFLCPFGYTGDGYESRCNTFDEQQELLDSDRTGIVAIAVGIALLELSLIGPFALRFGAKLPPIAKEV